MPSATRRQILRLFLLEAVMLSAAGGAAGRPERSSQTGIRAPAAALMMPGVVTVVSMPDCSPPPGSRQCASACPRWAMLP